METIIVVRCILVIIILLIVIYSFYQQSVSSFMDGFNNKPASSSVLDGSMNMRVFAINMDKDVVRMNITETNYSQTDLYKKYTLNRFPAVIGKNVNEREWLTGDAIEQLYDVEQKGFRTHHYQLTRGGIGCFLSHYNLAKQLLEEPDTINMYLVLEDDAELLPNSMELMQKLLLFAPKNWDMVLFHYIRGEGPDVNKFFVQCRGFWSMAAYVMNKKGARKLVDEVDNMKIDGQVDAYLSRMVQQNKMNIYGSKLQLASINSMDTNIQMYLREFPGIDPYNYTGYSV